MSIDVLLSRAPRPATPRPSASASSRKAQLGRSLGIDRAGLAALGLRGQGRVRRASWPAAPGRRASRSGSARRARRQSSDVRTAAAAFARAVGRLALARDRHRRDRGRRPEGGAQAVAEGAMLGVVPFGRYKSEAPKTGMQSFTLIAPESAAKADAGRRRPGRRDRATAVAMARDLVNTPGGSLNARDMADLAREVAERNGPHRRDPGRATPWSGAASAGCSA